MFLAQFDRNECSKVQKKYHEIFNKEQFDSREMIHRYLWQKFLQTKAAH